MCVSSTHTLTRMHKLTSTHTYTNTRADAGTDVDIHTHTHTHKHTHVGTRVGCVTEKRPPLCTRSIACVAV